MAANYEINYIFKDLRRNIKEITEYKQFSYGYKLKLNEIYNKIGELKVNWRRNYRYIKRLIYASNLNLMRILNAELTRPNIKNFVKNDLQQLIKEITYIWPNPYKI